MRSFSFTVDDNIIFLKDITEMGCESIFDHPYLAMYKRLHEKYDLKIQLNLFLIQHLIKQAMFLLNMKLLTGQKMFD